MRNLKRALSLALASVMLLGMMVVGTGAAYADVDSKDNQEAIKVLKMVGVMTGDENGNFNPDKNVTRNEMAVIMCNLLGLKAGGSHPFTDVPAWADGYVAACYNNDIIAGTSATTFSGDASVTAVQAGLMVMKALGYFGYAGEFGDNWMTAVVKQANKIDLYDGINAYTEQVMTRNDVAQLVLNALECTVVVVEEIGGMTVEGNGITVTEKPTYKYTNTANNSGKDYGDGAFSYMELCEKLYGNDLKKNTCAGITDDFKRPATEWTYNGESIKSAEAYDVAYTAGVKGKAIYADLGKVTVSTINVYVDGVADTITYPNVTIDADETDKFGANGALTEVYYDKDTKTATIVIVNTYAAEVTDCEKNNDDKYDITLDNGKTYESEVAYEVEDIVLYTVAGASADVKSMALATEVEGEVTYVKTDDSFKLAGNTYEYSTKLAESKLTTANVDNDAKVYLDAYGYVIKIGTASTSNDYAVVMATTQGSWSGTDVDEQAKLFFSDGTVKAVDVKSLTGIKDGDLVTYTVNSKGEYDLTNKASVAAKTNALKIEQGKATVTVNGSTFVGNSKTVVFFYNSDSKTYEVYTGIKNVPDFAAASGYQSAAYIDNGVLKALYITAAKDLKDGSKSDVGALFTIKNPDLQKDTDLGDYYELEAIVDGKAVTVKVDAAKVGSGKAFVPTSTGANGYVVTKIVMDENDIVTDVTVESSFTLDSDGDGYLQVTDLKAVKDEVITLNNTAYTYADDVTVFEYDVSENEFSAKTIKSLKDNSSITAFAQVEGNVVIALYYFK